MREHPRSCVYGLKTYKGGGETGENCFSPIGLYAISLWIGLGALLLLLFSNRSKKSCVL